jgi:hypothetical protein
MKTQTLHYSVQPLPHVHEAHDIINIANYNVASDSCTSVILGGKQCVTANSTRRSHRRPAQGKLLYRRSIHAVFTANVRNTITR